MDAFAEGYSFFEKNSGSYTAAAMGDAYVGDVNNEIATLLKDMNAFEGFKTKPDALKGDIAEFWHSDTFNIDAVVKGSRMLIEAMILHLQTLQVILDRTLV